MFALGFLCGALALILLFVAVVCVLVFQSLNDEEGNQE
jgi:hypothetical protein